MNSSTTILDEIIFGNQTSVQELNPDYENGLINQKITGNNCNCAGCQKKSLKSELDEVVLGADQRQFTKSTTKTPFRYICNLEYNFPGIGRRAMCTGLLIGPRTVLTAGHCLEGLTPSRMRVIPGRSSWKRPFGYSTAKRFIMADHYSGGTATDYAIIHLRSAIGSKIGHWNVNYKKWPHDDLGSRIFNSATLNKTKLSVNLCGYPGDKPTKSKYKCLKPSGTPCDHTSINDPSRSKYCGTFQYRAYNQLVRLINNKLLEYDNDTCAGHSGSPVWITLRSHGVRILTGIHIGALPGGKNIAVFLNKDVQKFIRKHVK